MNPFKLPVFTIEMNVNVHFPGITPFLQTFLTNQGIIMATMQDLETKIDELVASNTALAATVEEGNGKQDALILVASQTKDALVALQAANPAVDFQPLIDKLQGAIDTNATTTASITAQEGETDAATAADAP